MTKAPNHIDRGIGQKIRLRRQALGLSQEKLASALGISFQQLQKYEKGSNRLSAGRLSEVAHVLKVPVASFFDEIREEGEVLTSLFDMRQGLPLLRAFAAISHPGLRRQALELVRAIAELEAGQEAA